jgi:broad specificity phosphatase PhoE
MHCKVIRMPCVLDVMCGVYVCTNAFINTLGRLSPWVFYLPADPELVPEGRNQAREAHKVYCALKAKGIVNDDTPVFTTDRKRAVDTAKLFTGRENGEFTTDMRLLERLLGDWDSKLTERLQKEIKAIPDFSPPAEESPADHKAHVFECLDQRIADAHGQPIIIVSHGGTTRRIAAYFGMEEGLDVQNAVPHHAVSNDGGKSWELKRFRVDAEGQLQEEVLQKKIAKVASDQRTMESILVEHAPHASLSPTGHVLTIAIENTTNREAIDALASDLGQLLIGKCHAVADAVVAKDAVVVVKLDRVQAEIVQQFTKLKGMKLR